jgi:hypothetical protein
MRAIINAATRQVGIGTERRVAESLEDRKGDHPDHQITRLSNYPIIHLPNYPIKKGGAEAPP